MSRIVEFYSKENPIKLPHEWQMDGNGLTAFLSSMYRNQTLNYVDINIIFLILDFINNMFLKFEKNNVIKNNNTESVSLSLFLYRSHANFLAASSLVLAGMAVETYALIRPMIEHGAAALRIKNSPELEKVFLDRDNKEKEIRKKFSTRVLKDEVKSCDKLLGALYSDIYDRCINYGSHPNFGSISVDVENIDINKVLSLPQLEPKGLFPLATTKDLIEGAICVLSIYQFIFYERYKDLELDKDLVHLKEGYLQPIKDQLDRLKTFDK